MRKGTIKGIVIVMSIVLCGLIVFQFYWIKNALALREQEFEENAFEAIEETISKIERLNFAKRYGAAPEDYISQILSGKYDSLSEQLFNKLNKLINNSSDTLNGQKIHTPCEHDNIEKSSQKDSENIIKGIKYVDSSGNQKEFRVLINKNNQKISANYFEKKFTNPDELKAFLKTSSLFSDIFMDMFNNSTAHCSSEILNRETIDSLLKVELNKKGISTSFNFGIQNILNGKIYCVKDESGIEELRKTRFRFPMFPHNLFQLPNLLLVDFPNQFGFVLRNMWIVLSLSILLTIIIIAVFFYTLVNLVKQKKLSDIKNDFINNMTHEIKTPLSTISLACEALKDPDIEKSDVLYQNYLRIIEEENKRLSQLTENVLRTAILDRGELMLNKEPIDLHPIISNAAKKIELQVQRKNGIIEQSLNAENSVILGDPIHITNVIMNLLDNANKYTPENPKIKISTYNQNGNIVITVSDNGLGISKNDIKRIFDKFYRVPTGNVHNIKGYGLGLSYVKAIVEKHEGIVSVESELGKGSKFIIILPLKTNSHE